MAVQDSQGLQEGVTSAEPAADVFCLPQLGACSPPAVLLDTLHFPPSSPLLLWVRLAPALSC